MKHIAILRQPFYDMILSGEKTIESRWSKNKIAPYMQVQKGDVVFLKETGKNVTAKANVEKVEFYELTPDIAEEIRKKHGKEIGIDKFDDWNKYLQKNFCTLIWLSNVEKVKNIPSPKSHGAGWLVIKS